MILQKGEYNGYYSVMVYLFYSCGYIVFSRDNNLLFREDV